LSALIVSFMNLEHSKSLFWQLMLLVSGLLLLWSLANSKWVDRRLSAVISSALDSYTRISVQDYAGLLHLAGDYQITELTVMDDDWIAGKILADARLRTEGIMVLGITRKNGNYIGAPDGNTSIKKNDRLVLYGRTAAIRDLDQRGKGIMGDRDHIKKTHEQIMIREQEKAEDDSQES